jgi:DNA-directed RNA polymerase, mitochondrial
VAREAQEARLNLPGLPNALYHDEPPKPADIVTNEEARKKWRQARTRVIEQNMAMRGRVLRAAMTLAEADKFADELAIYFPHHCDFRGRIYPMPTTLNIQGPDLTRALLEFADGQPIEDAEAADWLAIHVANCFGQGKAAFADRIKWTHDNEPMLRRIAQDPLGNRREWEAEADGLWMALASAREWVAFLDRGYGFVTHLPCFIDGTCNGLQHFAALAHDLKLAALVNLTPSEQPQDIYRNIAKRASTIFRQRASKGAPGDKEWALRWSKLLGDGGSIPRSVAKSIVMTKPYGVTHKGIMDCVGELLDKTDPQHVVFPEGERPKARAWLAKVMQEAMAGQLGSADTIMRWLRQMAAAVTRHANTGDWPEKSRGFEWTTPTGWPWSMSYGRKEKQVAQVRFNGERSTAALSVESSSVLDAHAQGDAVSPNFIHALDASALVFALDVMQRCGVSGVGVIHDSVGGLATEMAAIGRALREGFVRLYAQHDPLQSFYKAALAQLTENERLDLPEPPEFGEFDVREVLRSPYFFA